MGVTQKLTWESFCIQGSNSAPLYNTHSSAYLDIDVATAYTLAIDTRVTKTKKHQSQI